MVGRRKVISSPPQAADFAPYHAATHVSGPEHLDEHHRRCGTRLHEQDGPQVPGSIARKGRRPGLADPIVTPQNTLDYYSAVEKAARGSVADHFRLFALPDMR